MRTSSGQVNFFFFYKPLFSTQAATKTIGEEDKYFSRVSLRLVKKVLI